MQCDAFFDQLWRDYTRLTPQAARIHRLFSGPDDRIVNDHVAFRTFNLAPINIASLEPHILALGYRRLEPYHFAEKKLDAWAYLPPDEEQPRIFFSELRVEDLSDWAQELIADLVAQVPAAATASCAVFWRGRLWDPPTWADYQALAGESEYAAWLAMLGLRANHFTISVNHLRPPSLQAVIDRVQAAGFALNEQGGLIKGTPQTRLEQAATLADRADMVFADGDVHTIATCYYEFARRYPDASGHLYQGFVPDNANSIFHSTDRG